MKKLYLLLPIFLLTACGGEENKEGDDQEREEPDYVETEYDKQIKEFLSDKNYEPERQESGLYIYMEEEGGEEKPALSDYLTLKYEGRLLDGTVFDGTDGEAIGFPFPTNKLIKGWQEAIPKFGKGGKGTLIVPPDLGYGSKDSGPIPGNSVLVFDIEIVDFASSPSMPPIDTSVDYSEPIEKYIDSEGLKNVEKKEMGLYAQIENEGSEEKPTDLDYVTLDYKGYLLDGTVFDETNPGEPATFQLGGLIPGWRIGIPYFGKNGKGKLIIPPSLGYGERGSGSVPPNAILVFDIEVLDFSEQPPQP